MQAVALTYCFFYVLQAIGFPDIDFLGVAASRLLGIGLGLVWIGVKFQRGQFRFPNGFVGAMILLVLWAYTSATRWALAPPERTFRDAFQLLVDVVACYIITDILRSRREAFLMLQAIVLAGASTFCLVMLNYIRGKKYTDTGRFGTDFTHPNIAALVMSISVALGWYLFQQKTPQLKWFKPINFMSPVGGIVGVMLTGSRGGALSLFWSLLYVTSSFWRRPWFVLGLAVIIALMFPVALSRPEIGNNVARIATIFDSSNRDQFTGRQVLWEAGLQMIRDNPMLGVGIGSFGIAARQEAFTEATSFFDRIGPHQSFIGITAELGLVGLVIYGLGLFSVFRSVWRLGPKERWSLMAVLFVLMSTMMHEHIQYYVITLLIFSLVDATARLPEEVPERGPRRNPRRAPVPRGTELRPSAEVPG